MTKGIRRCALFKRTMQRWQTEQSDASPHNLELCSRVLRKELHRELCTFKSKQGRRLIFKNHVDKQIGFGTMPHGHYTLHLHTKVSHSTVCQQSCLGGTDTVAAHCEPWPSSRHKSTTRSAFIGADPKRKKLRRAIQIELQLEWSAATNRTHRVTVKPFDRHLCGICVEYWCGVGHNLTELQKFNRY